MNQKLPGKLKLKSKKNIDLLFKEGNSIKSFPLIIVHKKDTNLTTPFLVGFSVSKRHFKHAVDRNRIKRLLRENFRKNKVLFNSQENKSQLLMFIFIGKSMPNIKQIEKAMLSLSKKLKQ